MRFGCVKTTWNALLIVGVAFAAADGVGLAQSPTPAEMAARLTGTWTLNAELTPTAPPSRRGRGRIEERKPSLATARMDVQRGGRGRGGGGGEGFGGGDSAALTDEEIAAQAALTLLHQVPLEVTIEATADTVTFRDPRGAWMFKIDGKTASMPVPGGTLRSKTKWDHTTLRQEFSSVHRKLVKSWSVDADGRLVLNEEVESLTSHTQSKAVFDRRRAESDRRQAP
jgi:hypothetical protein